MCGVDLRFGESASGSTVDGVVLQHAKKCVFLLDINYYAFVQVLFAIYINISPFVAFKKTLPVLYSREFWFLEPESQTGHWRQPCLFFTFRRFFSF